ncbi:MAG: hypothetical protein GX945_07010 [Lentisphaerae bacterium]|nr:hypothetical protein [Lentisphaerota bacterium]
MKRLIALACCIALTVCAEWTVLIDPNGNCLVQADGRDVGRIAAGHFTPGWAARSFTTDFNPNPDLSATTIKSFSGAKGDPIIDLTMTYSQPDERSLELRYVFTPRQDMDANAIYSAFYVNLPFIAGRPYQLGDQQGVIPELFGNSVHINRAITSDLVLDSTLGPIKINLDPQRTLLIQDNRRWNHNHIELRCAVNPAEGQISGESTYGWKGGQNYTLNVKVTFPEPYTIDRDYPVTMVANEDWIELNTILDIEQGSALDFTKVVNLDAPAGKHGWLKAVGQNFEFEGRSGVPQRFYGVNFCMMAHILTPEQCDIIADRLARIGFNTVRYHHHENPLLGKGDPKDSTILDEKRLAAFDYLFAALKKRGIYATTDVYVSRHVRAAEIYPGEEGLIEMNEFKRLLAVNENAFNSWKSFARNFFGHVNPHTGLRYIDDPAMPLLAMVNEGNIDNALRGAFQDRLVQQYLDAWNEWLFRKYPSAAERKAALDMDVPEPMSTLPHSGASGKLKVVYNQFIYELYERMYTRMTSFLREELGSKALFTDMNHSGKNAWTERARSNFDYVDDHFYIDHPRFLVTPWRLPSTCPNTSVIVEGRLGGTYSSFIRLLDKPMTITEWNYSGPGRYRGVGGILTGCLASLQNWAGLWRFAYSHGPNMFEANRHAGYFDVVADPLNLAAERAIICLFLRGDMSEAPRTVALSMDSNYIYEDDAYTGQLVPPWSGYNVIAKVGTHLGSKDQPVPADVSFGFSETSPRAANHISNDPYANDAGEKLNALFKEKGWLPKDNITDVAAKTFQSTNGQFVVDATRDMMILNTPRTAGGFAPAGQRIVTDAAIIDILDTDATVWVSSLSNEPISSSKRLLVTHLTDLQNTGMVFNERARQTVLKWGGTPHLVRNGRANLSIKLAQPAKARAYRLDLGGKRLAEVPLTSSANGLNMPLAVKSPDGAQMIYEIVCE